MKTKLLLITLLFSFSICYSQWDPSNPNPYFAWIDTTRTAGDELITYTQHAYTGLALAVVGSGLIVLGTQNTIIKEPNDQKVVLFVGAALSFASAIYHIESKLHIRRAGILLNEYGIGINIPINK